MIAVTADIHADNHKPFSTILQDGRNSRLVAILDSVRWIAADALKRKCDFFCIAGDLFHNRRNIEVSVLSEVSKLIEELSTQFKRVYILTGNHDYAFSGNNAHSTAAFKRANVVIVDKVCVENIGGKKIGFVPWTATRAAFTKKLKRVKGCDGIITHVAVDKAWAGPSDWEVEGDTEIPDLFKGKHRWVLMGHFHKPQSWEEPGRIVAYVGSPIQHTHGERNERKGYWIVPKSGLPKMIYNDDAPRFVQVEKKSDLEKVRPQDYVKTAGPKAKSLRAKVEKTTPNVVSLPVPSETIEQRLPPQKAGDRKIVRAFVKSAGVPDGLDPRDVVDIGLYLLTHGG